MVRLVPAKCPACGATVDFPENLEVGYCTHCGGKVLVEKHEMQVRHTGSVSSLPLCPSCGNTLTEGNRAFTCELCRRKVCYVCSRLNSREADIFKNAYMWGRVIHNHGVSLCQPCARGRKATCTACDARRETGTYFGRPTGRCPKCKGTGSLGLIFTKQCDQCHGTGRCPWCQGTGWVRLV